MNAPKANEWWFRDDGERRVFIHGISRKGEPIVETEHDDVYTDDWWEGWHHEPDCTGWDWVPPKYVTQDRVPARPGLDQRRWVRDDTPLTGWADASVLRHTYGDKAVHGFVNPAGGRLELRCLEKDLPPAKPEWPKYYETLVPQSYAYLRSDKENTVVLVNLDGTENPPTHWVGARHYTEITEAEAKARIVPPVKPPEQTRLEVQVGKRYVRRDGQVTGLIVYSGSTDYPFRDSVRHLTYKSDGVWDVTRHPTTEDLVSEYVEPAKSGALCLFMDTYGRLYAAEKAEQTTHKRVGVTGFGQVVTEVGSDGCYLA